MDKRVIRCLTSLLLGLLIFLTIDVQAQSELNSPKTFILLRHAEKIQSLKADPSLSLHGAAQAALFAKLLEDQKIGAIYSTPYKRTLETVAPLATKKGLTTQLYEPLYAISLLEQLKNQADSGAVVIVGHSNTIPDMVNALLDRHEIEPISEEDYGMIYVVTVPMMPGSTATVVRLRLPEEEKLADGMKVD